LNNYCDPILKLKLLSMYERRAEKNASGARLSLAPALQIREQPITMPAKSLSRHSEEGSIFMVRRFVIVSAAALAVAGCSTITEGTTQDIAVTTTPPGASCTLTRDGAPLATIGFTPGTVTVDRSSSDIIVTCHKIGFGDGNYTDQSDLAAATLSNIMTGGVGLAVDLASGAGTKYKSNVEIALTPPTITPPQPPGLTATVATAAPLLPPPPAPVPKPELLPPPGPEVKTASAFVPPPPAVPTPPPAETPVIKTASAFAPPPAAAPVNHRVFGIAVATLETDAVSKSTPKHGVVVVLVQPGTAAAQAGLAEGDVVLSIAGREIAEKGDIQRVISSLPAGSAVLVHIIRGAHELDLTARL